MRICIEVPAVLGRRTGEETKAINSTQVDVVGSGRVDPHSILHLLLRCGFGLGHSTARIASSNTVLRPFCVSAEHSRYFTAPISFAIAKPCTADKNVTKISDEDTSLLPLSELI